MSDTTMPSEYQGTPLGAIWETLATGKEARDLVPKLKQQIAALESDRGTKFADLSEADKRAAYRLRGLGFVLCRENEDASDLLNEPHFVEWVRWALRDGPLKEMELD